jgi:hypothetical protein
MTDPITEIEDEVKALEAKLEALRSPPVGVTQPLTGTPAAAAPAPVVTVTAVGPAVASGSSTPPVPPVVAPVAPVVTVAAPVVAPAVVTTGVIATVETDVVDEIAKLKAEFVDLESRFKTAASRLEDLVVHGVAMPVFTQAKNLVAHVAAIAKSL